MSVKVCVRESEFVSVWWWRLLYSAQTKNALVIRVTLPVIRVTSVFMVRRATREMRVTIRVLRFITVQGYDKEIRATHIGVA